MALSPIQGTNQGTKAEIEKSRGGGLGSQKMGNTARHHPHCTPSSFCLCSCGGPEVRSQIFFLILGAAAPNGQGPS